MLALITFPSTHDALRAEKLVLGAGLDVTLIPVPRGIASDCGLALRFESGLLDQVVTLLNGQVLTGGLHLKDGDQWRESALSRG